MIRKLALAVASVTLLGSGSAYALTPSAPANFGEVTLVTGFTPDPHVLEMVAGGGIDVNTQGLPANCRGFVTDSPDYKLFYTGGTTYSLYIYALSQADTTLVINDPSGNWICDDDGGDGVNPLITFNSPAPSGRYDIWVGTYSQGNQPATLYISELAAGGGGGGGGGGLGGLDPGAPANFGEVTLINGFTPDPHTVALTAGGGIDVTTLNELPDNCRGYVTAAPDYKLNYTAGSWDLYIYAMANADITLVINDPNGNWICDDDSLGSLNPLVMFDNPSSGRYDIWVGTYSQGNQQATLYISELDPTAGGGGGGGGGATNFLNPALTPNYGTVTLLSGAPHTQQLDAGGPLIAADTAGPDCRGNVTAAPDLAIQFTTIAGILPLVISVTSQADTTLVVQDPAGNWLCNDDTTGLDPEVRVNGPQGGTYYVWVGTYSAGNTVPATLNVSYGLGGGK